MNVAEMLAHALVQGLASALPLSPSGHQLVLRIWLGSPRQLAALSMVAEIGCMAALPDVAVTNLNLMRRMQMPSAKKVVLVFDRPASHMPEAEMMMHCPSWAFSSFDLRTSRIRVSPSKPKGFRFS